MWVPSVPTPLGKYELEALERERDGLFRNRHHLTPDQGVRLDSLIRQVGDPKPLTFPPIDLGMIGEAQ